ncbi:MAG TPA: GAF domain-containing protein, partial [Methylomirabilota bacterium]|nr:GAF domain-containing protein [Methylomirabilota bacterium]
MAPTTRAQLLAQNASLRKSLKRETTRRKRLEKTVAEGLEQQTATAEILKVISRLSFDLQPVLEALAEKATRLCAAEWAIVHRFDGEFLRPAAYHGASPEFVQWQALGGQAAELRPGRGSVAGRAAVELRTVHIPDALADPEYELSEAQRKGGWRALLGVPMLRQGMLVGVFALLRSEARPFTDKQIELVTTFADQAVIAIENVRLFQELEARNRDLTEALEQLTATSEILRVISSSPTDVQPVFDAIAESAVRLCEAIFSAVYRFDGELVEFVAHHGIGPEGLAELRKIFPGRPDRALAGPRAILDRLPVHIPNVAHDPEFQEGLGGAIGLKSTMAVPILREGVPIGAIAVGRAHAGPFSDRQIVLLKTFAEQAVIAIENVRLFQELQARTGELARSVEELKALGEVGRAVGSTLDLETVLSTIVSRAVQLSGTSGGVIYEYDEPTQEFHLRASYRVEQELLDVLRGAPIRLGEGTTGTAAATRAPVQVTDVMDERRYGVARVRPILARLGYRSVLAIPLLLEQRILGALTVHRQ